MGNDFEKTIAVIKYLSFSQTERKAIFVAANYLSKFEKIEIEGEELTEFFKKCWSFIGHQFLQEVLEVRDREKVLYLENLMGLTVIRPKPIPIFTLNYDNSVEKAAETFGVKIHTGFDQNKNYYNHSFEELTGSGIKLYKIHGSIKWKKSLFETGDYYGQISQGILGMEIPYATFYEPAIIMGEEKLEAKGYSLDMLFDFRTEINKTKNLCVVGYSFQDDHINKFLTEWYSKGDNKNAVVVDPGFDGKKHGVDWIANGVIRSRSPRTALNVFRRSDQNETNCLFHSKMGFAEFLTSMEVTRKID